MHYLTITIMKFGHKLLALLAITVCCLSVFSTQGRAQETQIIDPSAFRSSDGTPLNAAQAEMLNRLLKGSPDTVLAKTKADSAWNRLQMVGYRPSDRRVMRQMESAAYLPAKDWLARSKERWALGSDFFVGYSTDVRRWRWFTEEIGKIPQATAKVYSEEHNLPPDVSIKSPKSIPSDIAAERAVYASKYATMREAFLASADVSPELKQEFRLNEIVSQISELNYWADAGIIVPEHELDILKQRLLDYARYPKLRHQSRNQTMAYNDARFLAYTFLFGVPKRQLYGTTALVNFFKGLSESENTELSLFAKTKEKQFALGDTPMELEVTTIDGKKLNLSELKGKMVLVDFWNLGCSSCLEMFPKLKALYQENKDKGLEIISVSTDADASRDRVLSAYVKYELPWVKVIAGKDADTYEEKYGVLGVPHLFIIDKQGRMVDNGLIGLEDIKRYVKQLIS